MASYHLISCLPPAKKTISFHIFDRFKFDKKIVNIHNYADKIGGKSLKSRSDIDSGNYDDIKTNFLYLIDS